MQNQLIVYVPKKNVKKIILFIILGVLLSIVIFCTSAFSSAIISLKNKVEKVDNANLLKTTFQYENEKQNEAGNETGAQTQEQAQEPEPVQDQGLEANQ